MPLSPVFDSLARTEFATAINQSPYLMGVLSSVHLLGLTLIVGSSVITCLRCFGFLVPERHLSEVMRPAGRAILLGFAISLATGFPMFAPRAVTASVNFTFQIKMILLLAAVVFHFTLYRTVTRSGESRPPWLRLTGVLGVALWFAVAFAGCVFIVLD